MAGLREKLPDSQPETVQNKQGLLLREQLLAMGSAERMKEMQKYLIRQVAEVLQAPVNTLDPEQPLSNLGLDSLMAVDLKIRIEGALGLVIPVMSLLEGPSISQLADQLQQQLD